MQFSIKLPVDICLTVACSARSSVSVDLRSASRLPLCGSDNNNDSNNSTSKDNDKNYNSNGNGNDDDGNDNNLNYNSNYNNIMNLNNDNGRNGDKSENNDSDINNAENNTSGMLVIVRLNTSHITALIPPTCQMFLPQKDAYQLFPVSHLHFPLFRRKRDPTAPARESRRLCYVGQVCLAICIIFFWEAFWNIARSLPPGRPHRRLQIRLW